MKYFTVLKVSQSVNGRIFYFTAHPSHLVISLSLSLSLLTSFFFLFFLSHTNMLLSFSPSLSISLTFTPSCSYPFSCLLFHLLKAWFNLISLLPNKFRFGLKIVGQVSREHIKQRVWLFGVCRRLLLTWTSVTNDYMTVTDIFTTVTDIDTMVICCIFRPKFGCCALLTLVKIVIFSVFAGKSSFFWE